RRNALWFEDAESHLHAVVRRSGRARPPVARIWGRRGMEEDERETRVAGRARGVEHQQLDPARAAVFGDSLGIHFSTRPGGTAPPRWCGTKCTGPARRTSCARNRNPD